MGVHHSCPYKLRREMGVATRHTVVAVSLVLVCGLFLMELTAEWNQPQQVVQEAASNTDKSVKSDVTINPNRWEKRELKSGDAHRILSKAASQQQKTRASALKKYQAQQKSALVKQHNLNQQARKAMRNAATNSAVNKLGAAIGSMQKRVKAMTARAAERAAKALSQNTQFNKANIAAERKMKLLEKDVVLLTAAKKKVVLEAARAKQRYMEKARKYRAVVHAKVLRAEADLKTIQHKLDGYTVAQNTEKLTSIEMHKDAQTIIKLSDRLKAKQRRVARLARHQVRILRREKRHNLRAQKDLMRLIQDYKVKLQKEKSHLYELRHAPDISPSMRAKIDAKKRTIAEQEKMISRGDQNIQKLKRSLQRAMKNTKVLERAAAKRQEVLQTANKAYNNVNAAVTRLRAMAAERAKSVVLKAPRGSITRTTRRVQRSVKRAVQSVAAQKKVAFRKAIIKAAQHAAAEAANSMDAKKMTAETANEVREDPFSESDYSEIENAMQNSEDVLL